MCRFVYTTIVKTSGFGKSLEKGKTIKYGMTKLFFPIRHSQDEEVFTREYGKEKDSEKNQCLWREPMWFLIAFGEGSLPKFRWASVMEVEIVLKITSALFSILNCLSAYLGRKVAEDDYNNEKKKKTLQFQAGFLHRNNVEEDCYSFPAARTQIITQQL